MYKYETHLHTSQASACGRSTGAQHARFYHRLGYDGIFVTDHFFRGNSCVPHELPWADRVHLFCAGYRDAKEEGDRIGLKVFFAWEETMDGDDYLVYGLTPEWLEAHPEIEHCTRRQQLALAHAAGGCVVQAHPFRQRDYIRRILLAPDYVDAVEVANTGNAPLDDVCAYRYAVERSFYMTCGSDNHLSGFGVREPERTWGVGLEEPLDSAMDYVRVILERRPMTLLCPEDRLRPQEDMISPDAWILDEHEQPVLSGHDWVWGGDKAV